MSWAKDVSEYFQTSEEAFRLMMGIIFSYPIFMVYRFFLMKKPSTIQNIYFVLSGMSVAYWSIGIDAIYHSSICIITTHLTITVIGATLYSTVLLFLFNISYLLIGYWNTETNTYDICWTMPHCVLCLRLIAISMDVWDGTRDESTLASDQKRNRITDPPSLLEMFGQCFFLPGYLIGPQFSMNRFRAFIDRNINDSNLKPSPIPYAIQRISLGIFYILFHIIGSIYFPLEWVTLKENMEMSLAPKLLYSFVWVKVMMSKYIGGWLLAEGGMIISGLAYNGQNERGEVMWTGGANVVVSKWEFSARLQDLIDSFNINTNQWSASYVYKRMRFMNNKYFSQGVTMFFLASWHGLHSGYYLTFFNEFLMINFEKQLLAIVDKSEKMQRFLKLPFAKELSWFLGKLYIFISLPHCFTPFGLLTFEKYWPVIKSNRGVMYLFFLGWPLWSIPLKKFLLSPKTREGNESFKTK